MARIGAASSALARCVLPKRASNPRHFWSASAKADGESARREATSLLIRDGIPRPLLDPKRPGAPCIAQQHRQPVRFLPSSQSIRLVLKHRPLARRLSSPLPFSSSILRPMSRFSSSVSPNLDFYTGCLPAEPDHLFIDALLSKLEGNYTEIERNQSVPSSLPASPSADNSDAMLVLSAVSSSGFSPSQKAASIHLRGRSPRMRGKRWCGMQPFRRGFCERTRWYARARVDDVMEMKEADSRTGVRCSHSMA